MESQICMRCVEGKRILRKKNDWFMNLLFLNYIYGETILNHRFTSRNFLEVSDLDFVVSKIVEDWFVSSSGREDGFGDIFNVEFLNVVGIDTDGSVVENLANFLFSQENRSSLLWWALQGN